MKYTWNGILKICDIYAKLDKYMTLLEMINNQNKKNVVKTISVHSHPLTILICNWCSKCTARACRSSTRNGSPSPRGSPCIASQGWSGSCAGAPRFSRDLLLYVRVTGLTLALASERSYIWGSSGSDGESGSPMKLYTLLHQTCHELRTMEM